MTNFAPVAMSAKTPDPSKHVNFTVGMVLGVDDMNQEFAYLSERDRWLARDVIGYGTLCGLRVTVEDDPKGPRIVVTSGSALSPQGQLICVKPAQCSYLNEWLAANQPALTTVLGSPPGNKAKLYLTLCYRDCPVDPVPIAGEPCRTEDESVAPSRIVDGFRLELRTTAPGQAEEDAQRCFVDWLRQIQISSGPGPFLTLDEFEALVREHSCPPSGIGSPPMFGQTSPPGVLQIHPEDACEFLRTAFRIWVTEIRPKFHTICHAPSSCCGKESTGDEGANDECLLLAELELWLVPPVLGGSGWTVDNASHVIVDERRRPFLINLGLLQDLWTCGPHTCCGTGGETNPTLLLFPLVTNQFVDASDRVGRSDTTIFIINSNQKPFEISGACSTTDCVMHFYGMTSPRSSPPSPVRGDYPFHVSPGTQEVIYIGADATGKPGTGVAKGFVGYVIVWCNFPGAYGYAQIADRVGGSSGYVAVQLPLTRLGSRSQFQNRAIRPMEDRVNAGERYTDLAKKPKAIHRRRVGGDRAT